MNSQTLKTLRMAGSVSDGIAIALLWTLILAAGCSARPPQEPRTVGEFLELPRVGEDLRPE